MSADTRIRVIFGVVLLLPVFYGIGFAATHHEPIVAVFLGAVANLLGFIEHRNLNGERRSKIRIRIKVRGVRR